MHGVLTWVLGGAGLWAVAAGCWIADIPDYFRVRREERQARERQARQVARLKEVEDAMFSLGQREAARSSNGRTR